MALNVDIDMRVDPESEVSMSVEDGDEVSFGVAEAIVVKDHATLDNRDLPNQHPISAITGLAEALAESGKIDTVKVNGTALPVVNKAVDVPVPTTTSQLTNNSGFITEDEVPNELFIVVFSVTSIGPLTVATETTAYEIAEAVMDGKALYAVLFAGASMASLTPTTLVQDNDDVLVKFVFNEQSNSALGIKYFEISMLNDNAPSVLNIKTDPFLTEITSSDVTNALGYIPVNPTTLTNYMQKGVDRVTAGQKSGTTLGNKATAEGSNTTASGLASHAEGGSTVASNNYSHAEGAMTTASGDRSHAEGQGTTANGTNSHSENCGTTASGMYSHASGYYTKATKRSQFTLGEYNIEETGSWSVKGNYVEIVGNGTDESNRSNARTLDWSGNEVLAGTLTVGADPTANMEVATKQYVDNSVVTPPVTSVNGRTGAVTGLAEASALSNYLNKTTGGVVTGESGFRKRVNLYRDDTITNYSNPLVFGSYVNGVEGLWEVRKINDKLHFSTQTSGTLATIDFLNDGSITAKTQDATDNSTKVATTAFVKSVLPTVPTNVSSFTNDAGYLVASDLTEATDADVIAIVV